MSESLEIMRKTVLREIEDAEIRELRRRLACLERKRQEEIKSDSDHRHKFTKRRSCNIGDDCFWKECECGEKSWIRKSGAICFA